MFFIISIIIFQFLDSRENAADVKAKFIIEAANHPTDPEADEVIMHFWFTPTFQRRWSLLNEQNLG